MASRRKQIVLTLATVALAGGGYFAYTLFAAQAQNSTLAQAPMNSQVQVPPAFIMAMDDSRSMAYQAVFPTRDTQGISGGGGGACWSGTSNDNSHASWSFFSAPGVLRLDRVGTRGTCAYFYFITGARDLNNNGIPPIDAFGFARSHVYSYSYFNPGATYRPWARGDGTTYPDSSETAARIHPQDATPTFNLTTNLLDQNARSQFYAHQGMRLPAGMRYRLTGNNNANCGGLSNGNSNAVRTIGTAGHTMAASCQMYIEYFPATFYLPTDQPAPAGFIEANRVLAQNACSYTAATGADRCDMYRYEIKPDNYTGGATGAAYQDAIKNFANWFTYYGNRQRAAIASASHALAEVNNMRVGYFRINNRSAVTMYDMGVQSDKLALFGVGSSTAGTVPTTRPGPNTILGLLADGSATPNTSAVDHLGQQFNRAATRTDTNPPVMLACQKNAGMLFTDGFNNDSATPRAGAISGLGSPFDTTGANTMAAIASQYYFNSNGNNNTVGSAGTPPLRTDMTAGLVPVPEACRTLSPSSVEWKRLDCQSNLHMNFFAITLGVSGVEFDASASPRQDPFVTDISWPSTRPPNNSAATVDDLWHATVNTRGDFINANTPEEITNAMRKILATVSSGASPSGTVAITGARIGGGSLTVVPAYRVENEGTDWSGTLSAARVRLNETTRLPEMVDAWEASVRLPDPDNRRVFFSRAGTVSRFSATNVGFTDLCSLAGCNSSEITALGDNSSLSNAVAYLLGDVSLEKRNGGPYRTRTTRLGDIVNSTPVVSAPADDFGYGALGASYGESYRTYLAAKKTGRRYMVYVGANDGMLHAFDGGWTNAMAEAGQATDGTGGVEQFAYIPETALGHMGTLLFPYDPDNQNDQKFRHRYHVDGPITVSDAYYGGGWKTALVGTAGAGGRSVFALDVSDPGSFSSGSRLWEINDLNTALSEAVRNNIGHVLGAPVIVPVKDATGTVSWKAIFGNGFESASGKAVLFMVDIGTGTPNITMIEAQEVAPGLSSTSRNGLGNIVVVDRWRGDALATAGRDGFADTVYAADQQGALWKFDIRAATPASVSIPLFKTQEFTEQGGRYRQPILGGMTAASGPGGGVMIYFGTGSFSFLHDPADSSTQSLYAVNDTERGPTTETVALNRLVRYTVATLSGSDRTVQRQADPPLAPKGWYVDLAARERFVGNPAIASGVLFMPTYTPDATSGASANAGCSTGGFNALFGLNARTGAAALSSVRYGSTSGTSPAANTASVALNTGGTAPVKDVGVMAIPRQSPPNLTAPPPGGPPPPPPPPPDQGCWMMVTVAGAQPMYLPYPCGRQSWRQIQ